MDYKDYYSILGVVREASAEDIKRAYRKLARKYHPDVSKEVNAKERFQEINEANEVLKDPEKRKAYDQLGSRWKAGQEFNPPPDWEQNSHSYQQEFNPEDLAGFSDFFTNLFGQQTRRQTHHRRSAFDAPGQDLRSQIVISLEDAYHGSIKNLEIPSIASSPGGQIQQQSRLLKVKIPVGITEGQSIRLAGQGSPGIGQGPAGDLYLEVKFAPHRLFHADGADIYLTLPITPWEAALGTKLSIPTLGGPVEMKIPANSQSGQKLRLKGRGLPAKNLGDQYILLQLITPKAETTAAKEIYEKMAEIMPLNPRSHLGI